MTPVLPGGENGGAKLFVLDLLRCLADFAPKTNFVLLTRDSSHDELAGLDRRNIKRVLTLNGKPSPRSILLRAIERAIAPLPDHIRLDARKRLHSARSALNRAMSRSLLETLRADLLFCPFTTTGYAEPSVPIVSVIYDLQHKVYPQFFSPDAVAYRERSLREAVRRSSVLVAISDHTRKMAIQEGVDPELIITIHLRAAIHVNPDAIDRAVLAELNLRPKRYLLYPANFWPHKNHERLFNAFDLARRQGLPADIRLVCTGTASDDARKSFLSHHIAEMGLSEDILLPGFLDHKSMAILFANSAGLVFPSLFEGFGIPIVEAMAAGIPVACSNVTSLPEVAGDAALLFDPHDVDDIANAIVRLVNDQDAMRDLVAMGYKRAARFASADGFAERYWRAFETATQTGSRSNTLTGVFSDGWIGTEAQLSTMASDRDRHLRLDLRLPAFSPYEDASIRIRHGRKTLTDISVARGSSRSCSIALPRTEALIEISARPSFILAALGISTDERELSMIIDRCAIIGTSGDQEVLFP